MIFLAVRVEQVRVIREIHRRCAVGRRSRSGLIVRSSVRHRSVGPHAWSRARVDRLAPRKEPKPSGRGQPFHTVLRAGVALFQPKKLVCWGPGDALAVRRFSPIEVWMGPRTSALNSRHCPHERPSFCEVPLVKVRAMCICACPL